MKFRNYLTIFLATVSIFLLLALAGYLTYINTDDSNPIKQTVTDFLPDLPFLGESKTETEVTPAAETESLQTSASAVSVSPCSVIFVGDSRTVSMGRALQDDCT